MQDARSKLHELQPLATQNIKHGATRPCTVRPRPALGVPAITASLRKAPAATGGAKQGARGVVCEPKQPPALVQRTQVAIESIAS